jgi:hypothetical protein
MKLPAVAAGSAGTALAGFAVAAVSLAGLLLPAVTLAASQPVAAGCTADTDAPGAGVSASQPASPATPAPFTLCLSVRRATSAGKLLPGHDADFTLRVWIAASPPATDTPAGMPTAPSPTPSVAGVSVSFTAGAAGLTPHFTQCPSATRTADCPLGSLLLGAPATIMRADLAVPATATTGQHITFTATATATSPGLPSPAITEDITVAAPASPSPTPSATHSSAHPTPTPTLTAGTATSPVSSIGTTPPAGLSTTPASSSSLAALPAPAGSISPGASFPAVSPGPLLPSAAALPGLEQTSLRFPLDQRTLGVQAAGLAILGAAITTAVARLSLRRRPAAAAHPPKGGKRRRASRRSDQPAPPPADA